MAPVIAVEAGWTFSVALLASGEIYVWWPFNDPLLETLDQKNQELDQDVHNKARANKKREIPCVTFGIDAPLSKLPPLPPLPALRQTGQETPSVGIQLVQIAGLENSIVGLTNHGHVVKFDGLENDRTISQRQWQYVSTYILSASALLMLSMQLSHFSDLDRVREHEVFNDSGDDGKAIPVPESMKITHVRWPFEPPFLNSKFSHLQVTGNFKTFIAYSTGLSSLVLMGKHDATAESVPNIKPELQNRNVISIAVGDWHSVALTADGQVYTWGEFSSGALGLGDPANLEPGAPGGYAPATNNGRRRGRPAKVETPTKVRFDYGTQGPRDRFAFAIAAGGWHTGALAMDLNVGHSVPQDFLLRDRFSLDDTNGWTDSPDPPYSNWSTL